MPISLSPPKLRLGGDSEIGENRIFEPCSVFILHLLKNFMEENLWKFQQQTRRLQEQRADTQTVWDDSAARDLAMRYLNPHQDDNELMERGLKRQLAHIKATQQHLTHASEHAHQADIYAKQMQENIAFFSQESDIANAHYNTFSKYNAVALNTFPKIQTLINQANQAC